MEIALISENGELFRLCRELLDEAQRTSSMLVVVKSCQAVPEADFYIWDVDSNTVPSSLPELNGPRQLFLVDDANLEILRHPGGGCAANILLKPVTRAMLSVFLDMAFDAFSENNSGLRWDTSECLLRTNLRFQRYDHERSRFLASIAHDLRTPVSAVLGYCGLLLDQDLGYLDESQKAMMEHMQKSAARLSRMASAIFEISLESHRVQRFDLQADDLHPCVDQALHEVSHLALDKRIVVKKELLPVEGELSFDACLIERALINVFENSCRFTPAKGTIEVYGYPFFWERRGETRVIPSPPERRSSSLRAPNSYRVDIRNSGAAIHGELLESIFGEFIAAESSPEQTGCGLGLAICRTIMAGHHGRIWAENTERGPVFSFVLPCKLNQPLVDRRVSADLCLKDETRFDCHATT
jgi:signal transduction histidine kinase